MSRENNNKVEEYAVLSEESKDRFDALQKKIEETAKGFKNSLMARKLIDAIADTLYRAEAFGVITDEEVPVILALVWEVHVTVVPIARESLQNSKGLAKAAQA